MSLKYTYYRITSFILLATMIWNVGGWVGMSIFNEHMLDHADGEHCEVAFCYCEIEDGEKICTCHHPELHAKEQSTNHITAHIIDADVDILTNKYCTYTKTHTNPVQPDYVIVIPDINTTIPAINAQSSLSVDDAQFTDWTSALTIGFIPSLFRPPSV